MINHKKTEATSRIIFSILAVLLVGYIFLFNLAPLGTESKVSKYNRDITLSPASRFVESKLLTGETITQLKGDLLYFQTPMRYAYDKATVRITYQNKIEDQQLLIGFQDEDTWHYSTQVFDFPLINNLVNQGWTTTGANPTLYQKNHTYNSFDDFLSNPPLNSYTGVYNFEQNIFRQLYIPDYSPKSEDTTIDTPLRGKVTFYVYVNNEPFKLKVTKQDINSYEDPDVTNIKIYKEEDVVYSAQISDDGITDNSGKSLSPQEISIQNPGPELPESGVYKVVIDSNDDTIIKSIQSNLHKIVFESPLYPVSNHESYPRLITNTVPTKLLTDSYNFLFTTAHSNSQQTINLNNTPLDLVLQQEISTTSAQPNSEIYIPKSDVIIKSKRGYFFFDPDQYFQPTKYQLQDVENKKDTEDLSYLIANYTPPTSSNNWLTAELNLDLRLANPTKGKLGWIIQAPGLKNKKGEVNIKDIEIILSKKALIKI